MNDDRNNITLSSPSPYASSRQSERGNVFLFILLGVVLFGALTFTMSRGMRSEGTSRLSDRQADLAASDIMDFGKRIENAVNKLRQNGCGEKQLSFQNNITTSYNNTNSPSDGSCKIFYPEGGNVTMKSPVTDYLDASRSAAMKYGAYVFTGANKVLGLGTDTNNTGAEIMLILPYIKEDICKKINYKLGITSSPDSNPPKDTSAYWHDAYTGYHNCCPEINITAPQNAFCFEGASSTTNGDTHNLGAGYHYVHVLVIR